MFDPVLAAGTANTTGVVQKNRAKGTTISATFTVSDAAADLTYTGGTQYHAYPIKTMSSEQRNMQGTNVLGPGNILLIGYTSVGAATDAEIVSMSINCFVRTIA